MWKYEPSLPPLAAPFLKPIQLCKSSHWNNWLAGRTVETVGKQQQQQPQQKKPFITHRNGQNKPDRKRGIGCAGWVTVDRVRTTDEKVQEAVMSDICHQTDKKKKKSHSGDKRTQVVSRHSTAGSVAELIGTVEQRALLVIIY